MRKKLDECSSGASSCDWESRAQCSARSWRSIWILVVGKLRLLVPCLQLENKQPRTEKLTARQINSQNYYAIASAGKKLLLCELKSRKSSAFCMMYWLRNDLQLLAAANDKTRALFALYLFDFCQFRFFSTPILKPFLPQLQLKKRAFFTCKCKPKSKRSTNKRRRKK